MDSKFDEQSVIYAYDIAENSKRSADYNGEGKDAFWYWGNNYIEARDYSEFGMQESLSDPSILLRNIHTDPMPESVMESMTEDRAEQLDNCFNVVAFSNYWKNAIEQSMSDKKMVINPKNIKNEMVKSLSTLNKMITTPELLKKDAEIPKDLPYSDALEIFTSNPTALKSLFIVSYLMDNQEDNKASLGLNF